MIEHHPPQQEAILLRLRAGRARTNYAPHAFKACVVAEVREGGDALARAVPDSRLAEAPALADIVTDLAKIEPLDR